MNNERNIFQNHSTYLSFGLQAAHNLLLPTSYCHDNFITMRPKRGGSVQIAPRKKITVFLLFDQNEKKLHGGVYWSKNQFHDYEFFLFFLNSTDPYLYTTLVLGQVSICDPPLISLRFYGHQGRGLELETERFRRDLIRSFQRGRPGSPNADGFENIQFLKKLVPIDRFWP